MHLYETRCIELVITQTENDIASCLPFRRVVHTNLLFVQALCVAMDKLFFFHSSSLSFTQSFSIFTILISLTENKLACDYFRSLCAKLFKNPAHPFMNAVIILFVFSFIYFNSHYYICYVMLGLCFSSYFFQFCSFIKRVCVLMLLSVFFSIILTFHTIVGIACYC